MPDGAAHSPGVVLLHGATWGERRFYRAFEEAFTAHGMVTLAFDRRGEGESQGQRNADLFTLAEDAFAAVRWLRRQPEVDPHRVGLWGYSNGAWVATLAAGRDADCSFLLVAGASGVSPAASEVFRRAEDLRLQGVAEQTAGDVERLWSILFEYLVTSVWHEEWNEELPALAARVEDDPQLAALTVPDFVKANPLLGSVPHLGEDAIEGARSFFPVTRPDMGYDPIPTIHGLDCPVLVVLAEHDANLPMSLSLPRFRDVANAGADVTVRVLEGANHLFSPPGATEHEQADSLRVPRSRSQFMEGYLELMAGWMSERTKGRKRSESNRRDQHDRWRER